MQEPKVKSKTVIVKKTTIETGKPDQVESFNLPFLSSRVIGQFVNNKVIYDLKKRGRSEIETTGGQRIIFEVMGNGGVPRDEVLPAEV